MVRYAVANTPYFCTLFNSHSLVSSLKAAANSGLIIAIELLYYTRVRFKLLPNDKEPRCVGV